MKIITEPKKDSTFILGQFGDNNKMIIQIEDRRQFEQRTTGQGESISLEIIVKPAVCEPYVLCLV